MSVVLRCKLSLHDGATFNLVSKVIHDCFGFAFLCSVIGPKTRATLSTITLILVFRNSTENCSSLFQLQMKPLVIFFASRVFLKMFSQELGHIYAHLPVSRAGSFTAPPELRRTTSSKTRYSGLRSGKMNLEKLRRSRSESDSSHDEGVTLESVTDLQSRKDPERSMASSKMQCSAEVQWYRWPTLNRW